MRDSLRTSGGFQTVCPADNRMIVVGDGDMVLNSVVKGNQPIEMGMNPLHSERNGNSLLPTEPSC